jgi:hypothetical protein
MADWEDEFDFEDVPRGKAKETKKRAPNLNNGFDDL